MRFLADMGISPVTVAFLRANGHDASHLFEERLERLTDAAILAKALQEGSTVLTTDLDFAELVAASRARLPSVIIFRLRDMRPANVIFHLRQILERHDEDLTQGAIVTVNEQRFRVRRLPI